MRQLVVIKTGSTFPALVRERGDVEHWILAGMGLGGETGTGPICRNGPEGASHISDLSRFRPADDVQVSVVDVRAGTPLPLYETLAGVVITGSHDMVTDRLPWSERTAAWLPGLVERGIPTLGICYGHQLLAHALGGRVAVNPRGRSIGSIDVTLDPAAAEDPLLAGLASPLVAYVSHTQSVLELPPGARRLAATPRDPHHAFVVGGCVWGVQFHPEFDGPIAAAHVATFRADLEEEGLDADALLAGCAPTSPACAVLARFGELVRR